ncbi:hypothetical protein G7046_g10151 [Stylonectria norvegica]|nr:hypothetical protein G7046_g10151 [Stylonectria norvegica]
MTDAKLPIQRPNTTPEDPMPDPCKSTAGSKKNRNLKNTKREPLVNHSSPNHEPLSRPSPPRDDPFRFPPLLRAWNSAPTPPETLGLAKSGLGRYSTWSKYDRMKEEDAAQVPENGASFALEMGSPGGPVDVKPAKSKRAV